MALQTAASATDVVQLSSRGNNSHGRMPGEGIACGLHRGRKGRAKIVPAGHLGNAVTLDVSARADSWGLPRLHYLWETQLRPMRTDVARGDTLKIPEVPSLIGKLLINQRILRYPVFLIA